MPTASFQTICSFLFQTPVVIPPAGHLEADFLLRKVLQNVKKDATLNKFFVTKVSIVVPKFPKRLALRSLKIQTDAKAKTGSCAFELASRLGLLPGQPNERFGEFETVNLADLVHNDETYYAPISCHYLVGVGNTTFGHGSVTSRL